MDICLAYVSAYDLLPNKIFGPVWMERIARSYEKEKGGSRVEEILKRRAIGEWLGCGWGEMAAEILKREKWSRNKGIVCLRSPTT